MKNSFVRAMLRSPVRLMRLIPLTQMISTTSSVKQTLMIAFIKCMIR